MSVSADLQLTGLTLNGVSFWDASSPDSFVEALGPPSSVHEAEPPAPYGHRNHQLHRYDDLGIYLNEHHATGLITGVNFVLHLSEAPSNLRTRFAGSLRIGELDFDASTGSRLFVEDVAARSGMSFHTSLRDWHIAESPEAHITLQCVRKSSEVQVVSFGLPGGRGTRKQ